MARGKPGEGPYAGQGRQHQKTRDPATGETYNNHYYSYSKQDHMSPSDESDASTADEAELDSEE